MGRLRALVVQQSTVAATVPAGSAGEGLAADTGCNLGCSRHTDHPGSHPGKPLVAACTVDCIGGTVVVGSLHIPQLPDGIAGVVGSHHMAGTVGQGGMKQLRVET